MKFKTPINVFYENNFKTFVNVVYNTFILILILNPGVGINKEVLFSPSLPFSYPLFPFTFPLLFLFFSILYPSHHLIPYLESSWGLWDYKLP